MNNKIIEIFQVLSFIIGILVIFVFFIPFIFGIKSFIVISGSMEPNIKTGAVAYVNTNVKPDDIKVGDVIGFDTSSEQVIHRVTKINEDKSFTTKGDANEIEDLGKVEYENYKGKVIFSIPFLGKIIAFMKTNQGIFIVTFFVIMNILCIIFDKYIYNKTI